MKVLTFREHTRVHEELIRVSGETKVRVLSKVIFHSSFLGLQKCSVFRWIKMREREENHTKQGLEPTTKLIPNMARCAY